jgi:DNA modification methylase
VSQDQEVAAVWVDIERLKQWDRNPRLISDEAVGRVAESIKRFGFGAPLVARMQDGEVIAGHTRLRAALKLGLSKVPVRYLSLDPAEAHLLALADNRLTELTPWNESELSSLLGEYGADDALMAGWNSEDLTALSTSLDEAGAGDEGPEADASEDEIPELPKDPVTRPGDLWKLGQHLLVCGDCRDPKVVARLFEVNERANLAFTSPPYASQRKYDESSGFEPIRPEEYVGWFEAVQANVIAHLAPDGSWFVNIKEHSNEGQRSLYVKDLTVTHVRRWGWRFVDEYCWLRQSLPGDPASMKKFKNGWEPVFHYARSASFRFFPKHVRHDSEGAFDYATQKRAGKNISAASQGKGNNAQSPVGHGEGLAYPSNVLDIKEGARVTGHAAAFPVKFPSFFIRAFSDVGDLVYDPFLGSGTTLIAAEKLERHAVGCELSPAYCDVIVERWQNASGLRAERA